MSEMVERVAKAICNWQDPDNWNRVQEVHPLDSTNIHPEHFRIMARAAVEAMREPTDEMLLAMRCAWSEFPNGANVSFKARYQAAIHAALSQDSQGDG
jgi:enolase